MHDRHCVALEKGQTESPDGTDDQRETKACVQCHNLLNVAPRVVMVQNSNSRCHGGN